MCLQKVAVLCEWRQLASEENYLAEKSKKGGEQLDVKALLLTLAIQWNPVGALKITDPSHILI